MTSYHEVAGTRVDRIAALSDALYAIALTLTVLEVRIPMHGALMTESALRAAVIHLAPRVLAYLLSFLTLGVYWVGLQVLLNHLHRTDRYLTWLILGYLATIAIVPVSTGWLADYITYRTAVILYWLNLLAIGLTSLAAVGYALRTGLVAGRAGIEGTTTLWKRLVAGQILYAIGAALCVIRPFWSIAFIVIVQAYFALGPQRLPWGKHLKTSPAMPSAPASGSLIKENNEPC